MSFISINARCRFRLDFDREAAGSEKPGDKRIQYLADLVNEGTELTMKPLLLYPIAAGLLVLFAVGHTIGLLTFTPSTAEGVAVRDAMNNVRFQGLGRTLTYGEFYKRFGRGEQEIQGFSRSTKDFRLRDRETTRLYMS